MACPRPHSRCLAFFASRHSTSGLLPLALTPWTCPWTARGRLAGCLPASMNQNQRAYYGDGVYFQKKNIRETALKRGLATVTPLLDATLSLVEAGNMHQVGMK